VVSKPGSGPLAGREPTVTCEECGWTLRNDGDFDLEHEECMYHGCKGMLVCSSLVFRRWELREIYDRLKVPVAQRSL
jgi:hypothetical protein